MQDYFADFARNDPTDFKRAQVKRISVHRQLGAELDSLAQEGNRPNNSKAEHLFSNVYLSFSNYVHGKYPETMDLYGGAPAHFHLRGMGGTPKDAENLAIIDSFVDTVSITFAQMVSNFRLHDLVERDQVLADWFRSTLAVELTGRVLTLQCISPEKRIRGKIWRRIRMMSALFDRCR